MLFCSFYLFSNIPTIPRCLVSLCYNTLEVYFYISWLPIDDISVKLVFRGSENHCGSIHRNAGSVKYSLLYKGDSLISVLFMQDCIKLRARHIIRKLVGIEMNTGENMVNYMTKVYMLL
jgi:hypothetical protein